MCRIKVKLAFKDKLEFQFSKFLCESLKLMRFHVFLHISIGRKNYVFLFALRNDTGIVY